MRIVKKYTERRPFQYIHPTKMDMDRKHRTYLRDQMRAASIAEAKKLQNESDPVSWLITIMFVVMVLGYFFLSSSRPAWSVGVSDGMVQQPYKVVMGPAVSLDIQMAPVWFAGDEPVPYQYWDTSAALKPWYEMYVYQLMLEIVQLEEEHEQKKAALAEQIERNKRLEEWRKDRKNYMLLGAFGALIVTLFGTVFYFDKRRRRVKV